MSRYFESFSTLCKTTVNVRETTNISLVRQKNTKEVIINQEGTRMVKDGEDSHGLQMTNMKNLG